MNKKTSSFSRDVFGSSKWRQTALEGILRWKFLNRLARFYHHKSGREETTILEGKSHEMIESMKCFSQGGLPFRCMVWISKSNPKQWGPGDSSRDRTLGWWVHVTRTQGVKTWPPTRRWKGRFESPGMFYFCLKEDSAKWFGGLGGVWDSNTRIPRISLSVNPIFFHFPEKSNRNPNGIRAPRASIKPLAERLHLQLGRPSPPNKKRLRPPLLFFLFWR